MLGCPTSSRGLANSTTRTFIAKSYRPPPRPFPRAGRSSPKQIGCRIPQQPADRIIARHRDATHQGDRDSVELAHHQLGCGSELVHYAQLGPLELVAIRVALAPIITQRHNPSGADSDVDL